MDLRLNKKNQLRYGENPHQKSAIYKIQNSKISGFDYNQIAGKDLSYNNLVDTESALSCVKQFKKPACVIVKHANPCGVAESDSLLKSYKLAFKTDPTSAFGGILAFNKKLDSKLLNKIISQQFVEVIVAPKYEGKCAEIIKKKPNIRLLEIKEFSNSGSRILMKTLQNTDLIQ